MFRQSFASRLVFSTLAVLAFAVPAAAAEEVPLKGTLDGVVTATPVAPPIFLVDIEGGGNASHLGNFTVSVPHLVNRATRLAEGTYEFTAANGDTLTADFTGQSFATDIPGVLYIVEVATITGGTGRFAGATGSFTVERLFDTIAGTTVGSFEGTISTSGRDRH
jgi:hypothetical protein